MTILLALAAPVQAAFPGNNGKIAYSTNPEGSGDRNPWIATVNPDGSGYTRIRYTNAEATELDPQWSPDGRKIAFHDSFQTVGYQLATMNPDGSGVTVVSSFPPDFCCQVIYGASWSPDGRKLVTGFQGQLWIVNADGSGQSLIPNTPSSAAFYPDWSPDGSRIAFSRLFHGNDGIYTIAPDGSNLTQVTNAPPDRYPTFPHWSPDGARLAFSTFTYVEPYTRLMHVVDADGSNLVDLGVGEYPDWSPDGTRIAFSRWEWDQCIYTMKADGTDRTQVGFPEPGGECAAKLPDWQPIQPPGYARPKGASPTNIRLVPAFEPCTSPNASHGAPLSVSSCSPPQQSSDYLTAGTPDVNGEAANSVGLLTAKVLTEAPIDLTNGDQSDVTFTGQITDVRDKQTLLDYSGELRASFGLRLTDRLNGTSTVLFHPATAADVSFGFSFGCTPTPSGSVGSTCSVATSADGVVPGITPEFKRAVWQLGQVEVYDGGSDGDGDTTGDNTLFMTQGLFAP